MIVIGGFLVLRTIPISLRESLQPMREPMARPIHHRWRTAQNPCLVAGTVATYGYGFEGTSGSKHGDLVSTTYTSDPAQTPAVTKTYDRRGRVSTLLCNGMTTTMAYDGANELVSEMYSSGGTLNGLSLINAYDPTKLRRLSLALNYQTTSLTLGATGTIIPRGCKPLARERTRQPMVSVQFVPGGEH